MLDEYILVFLVYFISHGNHYCLELGKRRECILFGSINIIFRFLFPVIPKNTVNDFLGTSALMAVLNLSSIRCHSRSDDMKMGILRVIMGVNKQRLTGFSVSHFLEILVCKIQQLIFRHFVTFT